jgi:hypothetical protein
MKTLTFLTVAAALAFAAAPAFADPPVGAAPNPNANPKDNGTLVGQYSSQVKQNGPVVSDQAQSGNRSDIVQGLLGH